MKCVALVCVIAVMFVQQKTGDNSVRNQSQQNTEHKQTKTDRAPSDQHAPNPSDQKAAGDTDKNQKVDVVSVPKISVRQEKDVLDWLILFCTVILTIVGVVGTRVAIRTLNEIKRQADTLDEHKTKFEELATAARDNAKAASDNAQAANTLAGFAEKQVLELGKVAAAGKASADAAVLNAKVLVNAQRPWVFVDRDEVGGSRIQDPYIPTDLQFMSEKLMPHTIVTLKNFGESPASIFSWNFEMFLTDNPSPTPEESSYQPAANERFTTQIAPPSHVLAVDARPKNWIGENDVTAIRAKAKFLWVAGFIRYADLLHEGDTSLHETAFCYLWETRYNTPKPFWKLQNSRAT